MKKKGKRTWFDSVLVEISDTDFSQNVFIDNKVPGERLRVARHNNVSSIRHDLGESQRIYRVLAAHQFAKHVHRRSCDTFVVQFKYSLPLLTSLN